MDTFRCIVLLTLLLPFGSALRQNRPVSGTLVEDLRQFSEVPAISGREQQLAAAIAAKPKPYSRTIDSQNNVSVTIGSALHAMLVTGIDELGLVASGITPDGYLTVQRLLQARNPPIFND